MADIDDRVLDLLAPLFRSPMSGLADLAVQRINAAEDDDVPGGEDPDPFAPPVDERAFSRAMRQLTIVDRVVSGVLRRELDLLERMQKLRRELDQSMADDSRVGGERLVTVLVTGPEAADGEAGAEDLLTGARRGPLQDLLGAWQRGVTATTLRIEQDGT